MNEKAVVAPLRTVCACTGCVVAMRKLVINTSFVTTDLSLWCLVLNFVCAGVDAAQALGALPMDVNLTPCCTLILAGWFPLALQP